MAPEITHDLITFTLNDNGNWYYTYSEHVRSQDIMFSIAQVLFGWSDRPSQWLAEQKTTQVLQALVDKGFIYK